MNFDPDLYKAQLERKSRHSKSFIQKNKLLKRNSLKTLQRNSSKQKSSSPSPPSHASENSLDKLSKFSSSKESLHSPEQNQLPLHKQRKKSLISKILGVSNTNAEQNSDAHTSVSERNPYSKSSYQNKNVGLSSIRKKYSEPDDFVSIKHTSTSPLSRSLLNLRALNPSASTKDDSFIPMYNNGRMNTKKRDNEKDISKNSSSISYESTSDCDTNSLEDPNRNGHVNSFFIPVSSKSNSDAHNWKSGSFHGYVGEEKKRGNKQREKDKNKKRKSIKKALKGLFHIGKAKGKEEENESRRKSKSLIGRGRSFIFSQKKKQGKKGKIEEVAFDVDLRNMDSKQKERMDREAYKKYFSRTSPNTLFNSNLPHSDPNLSPTPKFNSNSLLTPSQDKRYSQPLVASPKQEDNHLSGKAFSPNRMVKSHEFDPCAARQLFSSDDDASFTSNVHSPVEVIPTEKIILKRVELVQNSDPDTSEGPRFSVDESEYSDRIEMNFFTKDCISNRSSESVNEKIQKLIRVQRSSVRISSPPKEMYSELGISPTGNSNSNSLQMSDRISIQDDLTENKNKQVEDDQTENDMNEEEQENEDDINECNYQITDAKREAILELCRKGDLDELKRVMDGILEPFNKIIDKHANSRYSIDMKLVKNINVPKYMELKKSIWTYESNLDRRKPLHAIASSGNFEMLDFYVNELAPVYEYESFTFKSREHYIKEILSDKDKNGSNSLHWSCMSGNKFLLYFVCCRGLNPNEKDGYGNAPIHLLTKYLLKKRAEDLQAQEDTPLSKEEEDDILDEDYVQAINALCRYKADINLKDTSKGNTMLHYLAESGDVRLIQVIVEAFRKKIIINSKNSRGETPLMTSIEHNIPEVSQYFISLLDERNITNTCDKKQTILHRISQFGTIELLESVYKLSISKFEFMLESKDVFDRTPFHYASKCRQPLVRDFLIKKKCKRHIQDIEGKTGMDYWKESRGSGTLSSIGRESISEDIDINEKEQVAESIQPGNGGNFFEDQDTSSISYRKKKKPMEVQNSKSDNSHSSDKDGDNNELVPPKSSTMEPKGTDSYRFSQTDSPSTVIRYLDSGNSEHILETQHITL